MKIVCILITTAWMFCVAGTACAVEQEQSKLRAEAEFSYVNTSGNSEVTTLSAKSKLTYAFTEKMSGRWKFQALNGKSDGKRDAEAYSTELRGDYAQTTQLYHYTAVNWLTDRFADIDYRYTLGAGSGYKFLAGPIHFVLAEAGLTYTMEKLTNDTDNEYIGGRLYTEYVYQITKDTKFSQSLEALFDFERMQNYMLNSETFIITAINSVFSFKTSYIVKYDNEPARNSDNTDTILAASLVANF